MQSMATYKAARVNALGHAPADFLIWPTIQNGFTNEGTEEAKKKTNEDL